MIRKAFSFVSALVAFAMLLGLQAPGHAQTISRACVNAALTLDNTYSVSVCAKATIMNGVTSGSVVITGQAYGQQIGFSGNVTKLEFTAPNHAKYTVGSVFMHPDLYMEVECTHDNAYGEAGWKVIRKSDGVVVASSGLDADGSIIQTPFWMGSVILRP